MREIDYYDGEKFITFNLIGLNKRTKSVLTVVSDNGRITQREFELFRDNKGIYIEYGNAFNKVYLNN